MMEEYSGNKSYTYDMNSRLTAENSQPFGYDWVGNRKNPPPDPNGLVFNNADELITWPGMHSYSYWMDGSLKEVRSGGGALERSCSYTPAGLLSVETSCGPYYNFPTLHYWDGDGNQVKATTIPQTLGPHVMVYDITPRIPAVVEEEFNSGTPQVQRFYYHREPDGSRIARWQYYAPPPGPAGLTTSSLPEGNWWFYHFDALGSTRLLTNSTGTVTDRYTYDAWGKVTAHTGTTSQPYQFVGQLGHYTGGSATGLLRARRPILRPGGGEVHAEGSVH